MLPPGLTTASAERDLSLLSRTPEELSWRAAGASEGFLRVTLPEDLLSSREEPLRETLPLSRDELLRENPPEEELLCRELERLLPTDDGLFSEDLRPTEDLLSEEDLPLFTDERLSDEDLLLSAEDLLREEEDTEDDFLLLSEDEERTELPELREEEFLEEPELRLDELLLEELLSEEDLRVVVVVVLPPLSLRVCASIVGAAHKSAPVSNAANESLEMFITQIFSCPQVRSTAWRTLVNISMLSPL